MIRPSFYRDTVIDNDDVLGDLTFNYDLLHLVKTASILTGPSRLTGRYKHQKSSFSLVFRHARPLHLRSKAMFKSSGRSLG